MSKMDTIRCAMKQATFFFRDGGIIVTEVSADNTAETIAQRMSSGGHIFGRDARWGGRREVAINLADVSSVFLGTEVKNNTTDASDIEKLAALEHEQWIVWSKAVADEVSEERRARWQSYWVPYAELSEDAKEHDRKWARRVLEVIT